jgi:PilZ domain
MVGSEGRPMRSSLSLATGLDRAFSILAKRDLLIEDCRYSLWQKSRRWERHKISVVLALHDERATTPMRLTATDISASGCYVETISPLVIGTSLKVDLWIASEKLTTRSFVRTSDPGLGMGIEFIGLKPEDQQRFQEYLKALNPWGLARTLEGIVSADYSEIASL